MSQSPILVTGATGKTGRRIVRQLAAAGYSVRSGSRSAKPAFDWSKPELWPVVLEGARAVYVSFAPDLAAPGAPAIMEAFGARARDAGVERLVLFSGRGEHGAEICEQVLVASGVPCTRLRASWFFQNFDEGQLLPAVLGGVVALPAGDVLEPFIDADDIADVAFAALTDARHDGNLYELTGPRLLSFSEAARTIATACGRDVAYVSVGPEDFEAALTAEAGADTARFLTELCKEVFDGRNAHIADGVERALGRKPRDFVDYCRAVAKTGVWSA